MVAASIEVKEINKQLAGAAEAYSEPPLNSKTWVLKVSIHCEGCKKKVKKILQTIEGVYDSDIDLRQQKVTVVGDVDVNTLLKKLSKPNKQAEIWPEENHHQKEKSKGKSKKKEKQIDPESSSGEDEVDNNADDKVVRNDKGNELKPSSPKVEVAVVQEKFKINTDDGSGSSSSAAASPDGGKANEVKEGKKDSEGVGAHVKFSDPAPAVVSASTSGGGKLGSESKEVKFVGEGKVVKPEGKKVEGSVSGNQPPPPRAETKSGDSEVQSGNGNGTGGKKKKKKGQNGNVKSKHNHDHEGQHQSQGQQSFVGAQPRPSREAYNHFRNMAQYAPPTNDILPRQHGYNYPPPHYHAPPPVYSVSYSTSAPPRAYSVSYNTASYPSTSYGSSYYSAQLPSAYMHSYDSVPSMEPLPSEYASYSDRQSDSFEMFSDENPNACSLM